MIKIGLLSDTHGFVDNKIFKFFKECDEIWHAGDIGNMETAIALERIAKLRAVYGNIDGHELRIAFPQNQRFTSEKVDVWITHIGGYPGRYNRLVVPEIYNNPPKLFISGHSHILKIMRDKKLGLLHINPGAAGKKGMHRVRTAVRFEIDNDRISNLEILEISRT